MRKKVPLAVSFVIYFMLAAFIMLGLVAARAKIIQLQNQPTDITQSSATAATPQFSPPVRSAPLKIRGSIPYWDQKQAIDSFKTHAGFINSVSLFWYFLSEDGSLSKYAAAYEDTDVIEFARKNNIKTTAVITNLPEANGTTWDSERVEKVIANNASRDKHIEEIFTQIKKIGVDGVTIDYEEVDGDLQDKFTQFTRDLAVKFHAEGLFVGIALHPKTGSAQDKSFRFQNWKELALVADELYIMAYGEHWNEGTPGPIASSTWLNKIISYAKNSQVPLNKFYLGVPLYGYDWELESGDKASGLTYKQIKDIMVRFDIEKEWGEDTPAPFFGYTDKSGNAHEVWFENAASVEEKLRLAREAGFGGVTFWRLGGEDEEVWERVAKIRQ